MEAWHCFWAPVAPARVGWPPLLHTRWLSGVASVQLPLPPGALRSPVSLASSALSPLLLDSVSGARVPSLCCGLETLAATWEITGTICFLMLRDHCLLSLEKLLIRYSVSSLVLSGGRLTRCLPLYLGHSSLLILQVRIIITPTLHIGQLLQGYLLS